MEQNNLEKVLGQYLEDSSKNSFSAFVLYIRESILYLLSKWKTLLLAFVLLIALLVAIYYGIMPKKYLAESTVVLENESSSQPSMLSQLGLGTATNAGLFTSADNMVWLYSNNAMIRRALFMKSSVGNSNELLINQFIAVDKNIKDYYKGHPEIKKEKFVIDDYDKSTSLNKNKVIQRCLDFIIKKYLVVKLVDVTNNIISISFVHSDEKFAYDFTNTLVGSVNDFYITTKTKKLSETIEKLEEKANSLESRFKGEVNKTAGAMDAVPFPNPNMKIATVDVQKSEGEQQISYALYGQIVQSLENMRLTLLQETPIIQIVDRPLLPLKSGKIPPFVFFVVTVFFGMSTVIVFMLIQRRYKQIVKEAKPNNSKA